MPEQTDVSTAQSFDVGSFLNNLVTTAGNVVVRNNTPTTQNTGQPAVTQTPRVIATGGQVIANGGNGMPSTTVLLLAAAALVGLLIWKNSK
jgi:hypothetical protein